MLGSTCSGAYGVSRASYQPSPVRWRATNMLSVKNRPNPGSARISARSAAERRLPSSTTSGTPSTNIREDVRLSASVSVMAPTWACWLLPGTRSAPATGPGVQGRCRHSSSRGELPLLRRVRAGGLENLVGPQVVGVAGRRRELVAAAVVGTGEVLGRLPGPVVL